MWSLLAAGGVGLSIGRSRSLTCWRIVTAFCVAYALTTPTPVPDQVGFAAEALAFALSLPLWVVLFKMKGALRPGRRTGPIIRPSIDIAGVFVVVTVGVWGLVLVSALVDGLAPSITRLALFWGAALLLVPGFRVIARAAVQRTASYSQNTIIVGTGTVGAICSPGRFSPTPSTA